MKRFFKLVVVLLLLSLGFLAFLLRNDFKKISQNREIFLTVLRDRIDTLVFTTAPRPVRIFLLKNTPGIFPATLVCSHLLSTGKSESLFSGDVAGDDTDQYTFNCPGGFEATLNRGAKMRLLPREGAPALQLLQGQVDIHFKETSPRIESDLFSFSPKGQPSVNRLAMAVSSDGFSIGCLEGGMSGPLYAKELAESKKNYLLARNCLFSVQWTNSMPMRHLMPGDALRFSDIGKSRKEWQPQDLNSRLSALGIDPISSPALVARIDPVPTSTDTVRLSWTSSSTAQIPLNCTLYSQESPRDPPQAAHRFQTPAQRGELILLKGFLKFWLSISCSDGTTSFTSNVIAPML